MAPAAVVQILAPRSTRQPLFRYSRWDRLAGPEPLRSFLLTLVWQTAQVML